MRAARWGGERCGDEWAEMRVTPSVRARVSLRESACWVMRSLAGMKESR